MIRKGWLRHLDFISIDIVAIILSITAAFFISGSFYSSFVHYWPMYPFFSFIHISACVLSDAYNGILQRGYLKEFISLIKQEFFIAFVLLFTFFFFFNTGESGYLRRFFLTYFIFLLLLTYILRFTHKFYLRSRYNKIKYCRQIVIASTEAAARQMIQTITESAIRNYQFFGLAVLDHSMIGEKIGNVQVSADRSTLSDYIRTNVVDEIFLNIPEDSALILQLAREFLQMGLTVHIYTEDAYQSLPNRSIGNVFGYNVLSTTISPISFRQTLGKRLLDILGGIVGCLITLILTVIIGPVIFIKSPGPIFFSQIRVGKHGREFKIYKFRSMYVGADEQKEELLSQNKMQDNLMFKIDDDPRIIKGIGKFIRRTSLDEFPQFWNVLKGDMSMVGTRPPTIDEYRKYSPYHKRRLSMLPGITGLWQVSGRSKITDFDEVVRLDTKYIENWSLELDIKIILKTLVRLWKNRDAF